ncbi:MAG: L-threonylcarbamoyladenylate synthase [Candidatus Nealsonbacteria bacterium]|nr:L-threonylcarbamoyladenylate synthase [Candidatus Nealsonbacteria bacterium]
MRILKVNRQSSVNLVGEVVKLIKEGKVIVCPTDTVYGLICDAENKKAVSKIFRIKNRPKKKLIPVFVKDIKMAKDIAKINKKQEKFLKKVWPGPVTVLLQSKKGLPAISLEPKATGRRGKGIIGIRMPDFKLIIDIIKILERPISETSANISGKPPAKDVKEILSQFKKQKSQPDLILDAGRLKTSKPSTVVDLTREFKILRI